MGTKLNKKNEKRKNIHRIFVSTRYKKRKNEQQSQTYQLGPSPLPQREKSNHRDTPHR